MLCLFFLEVTLSEMSLREYFLTKIQIDTTSSIRKYSSCPHAQRSNAKLSF